jgi:hypothetical protein
VEGSTKKASKKLSTSKPPAWEKIVFELADYRKIHGAAMFLRNTAKTQS